MSELFGGFVGETREGCSGKSRRIIRGSFEEENKDEDINGPLLEAGGTYATLAAQPL